MEFSASKQRVLDAALDLFAINGYEATSVSDIADVLGIKKPSIYSHFTSKQEIFDILLQEATEHYESHFLFDVKGNNTEIAFQFMTADDAAEKVIEQMQFLLHDSVISKTRKMLTIEQFRSEESAATMEKFVIDNIKDYYRRLIQFLITCNVFEKENLEVMLLQFTAPIIQELSHVDRNPSCEKEAMDLIRKHIKQFYASYQKKS